MEVRLLVIAIMAAVAAVGVGVACLVRIDHLERLLRYPQRSGGRGTSRLIRRGRVVYFPERK
jgi:hypothetical protein